MNYTSDLNGDAIEERWLQQKRRMMVEKMLVAMQKVAAEDDQGCRDRMSSYGDGQYQEELGCADPEHNKKCHKKTTQFRSASWPTEIRFMESFGARETSETENRELFRLL